MSPSAPPTDLPPATVVSAKEDPEEVWLREVYQPDAPNLTVRAVIVGTLIGGLMSLSNIVVFFKTGWSLGVTLTACILAFVVFRLGEWLRVVKRPLGMLENNALTTVASGAGYMTAGGNAAAFGALLMITTVNPNKLGLVAWFAIIAALGVFAAIPIKRQLINQEALPFPTGTATAETLRTIHGAAGAEAAGQGRTAVAALGWSGLVGAALAFVRDLKFIPKELDLGLSMLGQNLTAWTITIKYEVVLFGAGALMSLRTGWSLLLGGVINYVVIAPLLFERGLVAVKDGKPVSYAGIIDWTLWPGAAILVAAGLTSFALDYKSLGRAFTGIAQLLRRGKRGPEVGIAAVEVPEWWFPAGLALLTPAIVALMYLMFDIPVWAALFAVPLAVVMGFIASRVTGETDVTPTKALGPVTQMVYGAITPGNLTGNIMSANVTGGIGLHAADLLTTLKTGWLLGAKPRHQVYAQLFGVATGAVMIVPLFYLLIDPTTLGSDEWPAPSCTVWASVSKAFVDGVGALHYSKQIAILVGLALGVGLTLIEKAASKHVRTYLPSAFGLGLAMVIPFANSLVMFLGVVVAEVVRRKLPRFDGTIIPIASGLIAGESLMVVAIKIAENVG